MFDYAKSTKNRENIEMQLAKVNKILQRVSQDTSVLRICVEKLLDGLNTEVSTKPEYLSSENILKSYLALHEPMQALETTEPLHLRLELEIVFAIARQYTALKEYRLSSFYLGYAYQLINKQNLPFENCVEELNNIDCELQLQQTLYTYDKLFPLKDDLATRLLNNWYSFARMVDPFFLTPYLALQSSMAQTGSTNNPVLEELIKKVSHPFYDAKGKDDVTAFQPARIQEHRNKLEKARSAVITSLEHSSIEIVQATWSTAITECINALCEEVKQELGEPYGYRFCLLSLGSLSRDEACLRSDIEFALLCEEIEINSVDVQTRDNIQKYFQAFVGLLELKIIALGETNELLFEKEEINQNKIKNALRTLDKQYGTRDAIPENVKSVLLVDNTTKNTLIRNIDPIKRRAKRGLQFDEQGNYPFGVGRNYFGFLKPNPQTTIRDDLIRLIQIPATISQSIKQDLSGDKGQLFSNLELEPLYLYLLIDAGYLYGDKALAEIFINRSNELLQETYIENHWKYHQFLGYALGLKGSIELPKIIDDAHLIIKHHLQFVQWIVKSLAFYYDIKERNSIKRIQDLVKGAILQPYIGALLTQVVQFLFQTRLKAHHHYGAENDILYLSEHVDESLFSLKQASLWKDFIRVSEAFYRFLEKCLREWQGHAKQFSKGENPWRNHNYAIRAAEWVFKLVQMGLSFNSHTISMLNPDTIQGWLSTDSQRFEADYSRLSTQPAQDIEPKNFVRYLETYLGQAAFSLSVCFGMPIGPVSNMVVALYEQHYLDAEFAAAWLFSLDVLRNHPEQQDIRLLVHIEQTVLLSLYRALDIMLNLPIKLKSRYNFEAMEPLDKVALMYCSSRNLTLDSKLKTPRVFNVLASYYYDYHSWFASLAALTTEVKKPEKSEKRIVFTFAEKDVQNRYQLHPDFLDDFITSEGEFLQKEAEGSKPVTWVATGPNWFDDKPIYRIHAKLYPGQPGMSKADEWFNTLLVGSRVVTRTSFCRCEIHLSKANRTVYPMLLSHSVLGQTLKNALLANPKVLTAIDNKTDITFANLFQEDGHAANYICREINYPKSAPIVQATVVTSIDSDHFLVSPFKVVRDELQLMVTLIFFCDEKFANSKVDPQLIASFRQLKIGVFLENWLHLISDCDLGYTTLFSDEEIARFGKGDLAFLMNLWANERERDEKTTFVSIWLSSITVKEVDELLSQLQYWLVHRAKKRQSITHGRLMSTVHPIVYQLHRAQWSIEANVLQRFFHLAPEKYQKKLLATPSVVQTAAQTTLQIVPEASSTTTRECVQSRIRHELNKNASTRPSISIQLIAETMSRYLKILQSIEPMSRYFETHDFNHFNQLTKSLQQRIIEATQFGSLEKEKQNEILNWLLIISKERMKIQVNNVEQASYERLNFHQCQALNDVWLRNMLNANPLLRDLLIDERDQNPEQSLVVRPSALVGDFLKPSFGKGFLKLRLGKEPVGVYQNLEKLFLFGMIKIQDIGAKNQPITFHRLRRLQIKDCHGLVELNLKLPALTELWLENCPGLKLTKATLDHLAPKLIHLVINSVPVENNALTSAFHSLRWLTCHQADLHTLNLKAHTLEGLDLSDCSNLRKIQLFSPTNLIKLNVSGCRNLTRSVLLKMVAVMHADEQGIEIKLDDALQTTCPILTKKHSTNSTWLSIQTRKHIHLLIELEDKLDALTQSREWSKGEKIKLSTFILTFVAAKSMNLIFLEALGNAIEKVQTVVAHALEKIEQETSQLIQALNDAEYAIRINVAGVLVQLAVTSVPKCFNEIAPMEWQKFDERIQEAFLNIMKIVPMPYLNLAACESLTLVNLDCILKTAGNKLVFLDISNCPQLNIAEVFDMLGRYNPNVLDIYCDGNLNLIHLIIPNLPYIKTLSLKGCENLSSIDISKAPELKFLYLPEKVDIDDTVAARLASNFDQRCEIGFNAGHYTEVIEDYSEAIRLKPENADYWNNRGSAKDNLGQYTEAMDDYSEAIRLKPKNADYWYNRGDAKYNLGQYAEAIDDYSEAIRLKPEDADYWYNRGDAKYNLGQYAEAIDDYSEAIRLKPEDADLWHNRGIAKKNLGRYAEAIEDYNEAIRLKPENADYWYYRGAVKYSLGDYAGSIQDYSEAIQLEPDNDKYWNHRGNAKYSLGDYVEAIKDYNEAIWLKPDNANYWHDRGMVKYNLGDYVEAIKDYNEAIRLKPGNADYWHNRGTAKKNLGLPVQAIENYTEAIRLKQDDADFWNNRGIVQYAVSNYDEAIADFSIAIRLKRDNAAYWYNCGAAKSDSKHYIQAIEDYTEAIQLKPENAGYWNNRGDVKKNLGDYAGSIQDYSEAIQLEPDNDKYWNHRGNAKYSLGHYAEAIEDYNKAIQLKPDNADAWNSRGNAKKNLGQYAEGVEDCYEAARLKPIYWSNYNELIRLKPENAVFWNERGTAKYRLSNYVDAIKDYNEAIRLKPDDVVCWNNRGNAKYNLGRHIDAIVDYDEAIRLMPSEANYWCNRGNAKRILGRYMDAIADYNETIRLKPDNAACWNNRGNAKYNLNRYEEAILDFDEAIRINSDSVIYWNNRGNAKYNLGRYIDAIVDYDEAIRLRPSVANYWNNRGNAKRILGRYMDAIADYNETIRLQSANAACWNNRGIAKFALGRYVGAIFDFDEAIHINPDHVIYWDNRGNAKFALGRHIDAIVDYDEAIRLMPSNAGYWNNRGYAKYSLGRYIDAIADYDKAIRLMPNRADYWNRRGIAKFALGRYENAIADYNQAIRQNCDKSEYWYNCGAAKFKLGRYVEAIQDYDKAIRLKPDNADYWHDRGAVQYNLGHYAEAIDDYNEAIRLKSGNADYWHNRGIAKKNLGLPVQAIEDYTEAIRLKQDDADFWNNRGIVQYTMSRYDEAIADFSIAIQLKRDNAAYWYNCGAAKADSERYIQAIEDYTEAIRLKPDNAVFWNHRGVSKTRLGYYADALIDYSEAIRLEPECAEFLNNRGLAKVNISDYAGSIKDYNEAIKLKPGYADFWVSRGIAKKHLRLHQEAIEDFKHCLEIEPNSVYSNYRLARYIEKGLWVSDSQEPLEFYYERAKQDYLEHVSRDEKNINLSAYYRLGVMHLFGRGFVKDLNKSVFYFKNIIQSSGDILYRRKACMRLGYIMQEEHDIKLLSFDIYSAPTFFETPSNKSPALVTDEHFNHPKNSQSITTHLEQHGLFKGEKIFASSDKELLVEYTSDTNSDFEPTTMRKTKQ